MNKKEKHIYMRQWRLAHTDKRRAYMRRWRAHWRKTKKAKDYILIYKTKNKEKIRQRQKKLYVKNKNRFDLLKHKPCYDCQGWFEPCQMDFDHRNRATKKYSLARCYGRLLPDILEEIKKCDLVCANCHRLRTFKRRNYDYSNNTIGIIANNKLSTLPGANQARMP